MKLASNIFISISDAQKVLGNLCQRVAEIGNVEYRNREYDIMHKHIRALANQEERVVDYLNKHTNRIIILR